MNSFGKNRRHIHYVDHTLQKWLLQALIVMETVLVALAIWALYRALDTIIDEEMYRIHYSGNTEVLPLLIKEGSIVLGWMLLVNLLALFAADRIWAFFVQDILKKLTRLMLAAQDFDFSSQSTVHSNHLVLEQALTWREAEAQRLKKDREIISSLAAALPASAEERAKLVDALSRLQSDRR
jgi:hypothetical protein